MLKFRKKKVSGNFSFTRSGRIQKSQIKKKKNFLWEVFPCGFSISSEIKGGKSKWFCFFP